MTNTFKALLLEKLEGASGGFQVSLRDLPVADLPEGDVLIEVKHSTINYKDALALTNRAPVVRQWPMVPGIDGAGVVLESQHPNWKAGDWVIHNGWGVGETRWGCLATRARLKGDGLVRLPSRPRAMSTAEAMSLGTAGYTAALCVLALERGGVTPSQGEVLVTGATGGVGSVAVTLLANAGFKTVAATGKTAEREYLLSLGASDVIERSTLTEPGKPLQKERWAGVIDTLGSHALASACAQTRYGGVVAACGLAQGADLPATVMPFILRGVTLAGVDSVMAPLERRQAAWDRLARDLSADDLARWTHAIGLDEAASYSKTLMDGTSRGRVVVAL